MYSTCRVGHKAVPVDDRGLAVFGGYGSAYTEPLYYVDLRMLGKTIDLSELSSLT